MRRIVILLASALTLGAAAPASADFHGACTPPGVADVALTNAGGAWTYRGYVECGGATQIEITSLNVTGGYGFSHSASPASCTTCDQLEAVGETPAPDAGQYRVRMTFNVRVGTQTFAGKSRQRDYQWDGTTLVAVGPPPAPPPALGLCSTSQPRSATVAFANEVGPPPIYRWSGQVTCHGVDAMQISELSSQRRTTVGAGPVRHADLRDAYCEGCLALSAQGNAPLEGPGTYRVVLRYAIKRGTEVRSATIQRDFNSLGAGPILP